jgi:HAD superfamily hydrolase (TIGR01509 family)
MTPTQTAVIFDMDGLMVDSEPMSRRAWDEFLRPYGGHITDDLQAQIIGLRADLSTPIIRAHFNIPFSDQAIIQQRMIIYQQMRAQGVPPMPGLFPLLATLAERHIPWAVATSSARDHAEEILTQLGLQPDATACGNEVTHSKPAPDIYLLAAERLGVNPAHCLALDDSAPGTQSAVAAGMFTIAVPNSETRHSNFSHAQVVVDSLWDVLAGLDNWL